MEFSLDFENGSVYVERLCLAPFRRLGIESDQIPERARVPTAAGLLGMQLAVQFFGDQVVLVPELNDPVIWNAGHH